MGFSLSLVHLAALPRTNESKEREESPRFRLAVACIVGLGAREREWTRERERERMKVVHGQVIANGSVEPLA